MSKLHHVVTDLHQVYLTEMEAKIKPQMGNKEAPSSGSGGSGGGGAEDNIKKQARQLAYDTRYKARREDIPLERAWSQVLQNSSASAPVKELAKNMIFGGVNKEEFDIEEGKTPKSGASGKKDMVLVTPVKGFGKPYRRYADLKKKYELRKNPQIQSVVGTSYGAPYEGEKEKGEQTANALQHKPEEKKAKKDYDRDGKLETPKQEWKGSRDKAIKKAIAKKSAGVKEEYSFWREDLREVMDVLDKEKTDNKISEKKVNNKIVINPSLKEAMSSFGAEIINLEEIAEDYLIETIDIASEYFFNQGLNEKGLDIVIEELGLEKFTDFIFYISEDYNLVEARRSGRIEPVTKSGKSVGSLKGGSKTAAINRLRKEKQSARSGETSSSGSSGMTAALKSQSSIAKKVTTDKGKRAIDKAKKEQPANKPLKDRIAKGVLGAVKAYQQGMERHKAATQTAGKALKVAAKGASEFGKGVASGVKTAGKAAQAAHKVLKNSYEMDEAVYGGEQPEPKEPKDTRMTVTIADKKANTPAYQKYKSGDKKYKAAPHLGEAKKMKGEDPCWKGYEMVGTKKKGGKEVPNCVPKEEFDVQEVAPPGFEGTVKAMKRHKGEIDNPYALAWYMKNKGYKSHKKKSGADKVSEAISTVTGQQQNPVASKQQDIEQKQTKNAQAKLAKILAAKRNLQQAQTQAIRSGVTNIGDSFEVNGQSVSELNRYERETGIDTKTGKPTQTGGMKNDPAFISVKGTIRKMEGTPTGQRKKVPGKKPLESGQYGAPQSPAQKVSLRRAAERRSQENMSSKFD